MTTIYAALQSLPLIALLIVAGDAAANTPIENLRQIQLLIDDAEKALADGNCIVRLAVDAANGHTARNQSTLEISLWKG